jgi:hypothetical protein
MKNTRLVACPGCGHEVSRSAKACPRCGERKINPIEHTRASVVIGEYCSLCHGEVQATESWKVSYEAGDRGYERRTSHSHIECIQKHFTPPFYSWCPDCAHPLPPVTGLQLLKSDPLLTQPCSQCGCLSPRQFPKLSNPCSSCHLPIYFFQRVSGRSFAEAVEGYGSYSHQFHYPSRTIAGELKNYKGCIIVICVAAFILLYIVLSLLAVIFIGSHR